MALKSFDLSADLKKGENILAIKAMDGGAAPCGLLAMLRIEYEDGEISTIKTDSSWLSSVSPQSDWMSGAHVDRKNWLESEELAPYGKGPWADKIAYTVPGRK